MSFLAPFFLIGGLAIAGPILFHLIRQATRERKLFSSLMFLLPSSPRISKRHRLEHLLLLLLRCLALALLAFGFARPFLPQTELNDPTVAQPKRIVVLLDLSASMRRDGVWAAARERVEAVLRKVGQADQVAVYTFDRQAELLLSFDDWNRAAPGDRVVLATGRLGTVTPGWGGTHLGNALITAAEALGESDAKTVPGPRQIFLVSDLQAGSRLDALQAYEWPKGVELFLEAVKARNPTNAGLQLVADSTEASRAPEAGVRVRVTNAAESKREQLRVGWTRAANPAEFVAPPIEAYVSPGQARVFVLPLPTGVAGAELLVLTGDDENFDNILHLIPPVQQRASVLWLGGEAPDDAKQPLFFLRRAFSDTPQLAVQVVAHAPAAPLRPEEVRAASVIFVADALPSATAGALREQVLAGKLLVFTARNAGGASTLGALLGRDSVPLEEARLKTYAMFAEINFQHPLFAPFSDPRFSDFTKIHIWKYRKLDAAAIPEARVLAKWDSGDPAVLEVPVGQGRIYILTAGWQPEDSQLAISSKFVPLVWSWLELGGGVTSASTQFFVGDKVSRPVGADVTGVRQPDGTTAVIAAGAKEFAAAAVPGIYEFTGAARSQRFAVNVDANESRTMPMDLDELEHLGVPVAQAHAAVAPVTSSQQLLQGMEAENRQKLWRWFIAATLAVLLVETALAGWTARRLAVKSAEVAP
ncbi:MAG: VWA domain-containing protein [Opitutus sp.]|nr:VWA domain-containing protein [Opitutus sp.]